MDVMNNSSIIYVLNDMNNSVKGGANIWAIMHW